MTSFEVDITDVIPCDYCGARVGEMCHTKSGTPMPYQVHACRIMIVDEKAK